MLARAALHRGQLQLVRDELVSAQRLRHEWTYAIPHLAVQTRIELARVYIALGDLAGARTLMREIDGLFQRGPAWAPSSARPRHCGPSCPGRAVQASPGRPR